MNHSSKSVTLVIQEITFVDFPRLEIVNAVTVFLSSLKITNKNVSIFVNDTVSSVPQATLDRAQANHRLETKIGPQPLFTILRGLQVRADLI
jgi:hypothetical protein